MSQTVMNFCGYVACVFLALLAGSIIYLIWSGKIDLRHLVSEANHEASMSRFQLLIFTFVVAIGMFELIEKNTPPAFPDIPQGVLTLLGISATTYAVGKGISYSQPQTLVPKAPPTPDDVQRAKDAADSAQAAAATAAQHASTAQTAAQQATHAKGPGTV